MRRAIVLSMVALLALPALPFDSVASAATPRPAAAVSSSFTDALVGAAAAPVAVSPLPDGRVVVLEKAGSVRVVRNGALLATPALHLNVCAESERGLLGFTPDPAFGVNGFVYVYYTRHNPAVASGCVNRVSRFTMRGDTIAPSSEVMLLDNIGSPAGNHNGGDVAVGNDGYLYVSVGDGGCGTRNSSLCAGANPTAQDLSLLNGKILRVNRATGAPAVGNPLTGAGTAICRTRGNTPSTPTTKCREIFSWGLRNPWRFAFDPNTGATRFFINDVGQGTREEVDLGVRGANYGWPSREGVCAQGQNPPCAAPGAAFTQPLTDYQHGTGSYITGGAFVPNGAWGKAFDGGYLFSDGNPGSIFFRSAGGAVNYASPFATAAGGVSDIAFVLESRGWVLYYALPGSGQVRKIVPRLVAPAAVSGLAFTASSPRRVFDSRTAGATTGPLRAGTTRLVRLAPTRGAHRAALVNLTLVNPASSAVVAMWQPRTLRPSTSNMNGARAQITTNASVVPVDPDGNVMLFVNATSHVVVDVLGFFDVTTGGQARAGRLVAANPGRAADTRAPANGTTNRYTRTAAGADTVVNVPIVGRFGVASGAASVALTVTAIGGPAAGVGQEFTYAHGAPAPGAANIVVNGPSDIRTNLVVVPLGANGSIDLRLRGVRNVTVDVLGSFTGPTAALSASGTYVLVPASRAVDTRSGRGFARLAAGGTRAVNPTSVPDSAMAVTENVVMVAPAGRGVLTAYSGSLAAVPGVSTVVVTGAGQVRSAGHLSRLGAGSERFHSTVATDVVVDVTGWFR